MKTHLPCSQEKRGEFFLLTKWGDGDTQDSDLFFCQFLIIVDTSKAPVLNSSVEFIQGNSFGSQGHKDVGPDTADCRPAEQGNVLGSL